MQGLIFGDPLGELLFHILPAPFSSPLSDMTWYINDFDEQYVTHATGLWS